ncbi:terminase large subunit domain-containing protein [Thalassobius sp. Cn5-15]|uniref:DNA-packaging protein n=1 Tax=Thalassobius sp. Cn5-15 TaxID=2917763 RepID=UPI001EF22BBE|nr:terminase family protein [Thalassobius sp. Cn5-15]
MRSAAGWIGCADAALQNAFLDELSEEEILALPYLFEFWALDHQLPPAGDWRAWVILGGRGAGKTRAGAEWVRAQVEGARPLDKGRCQRLAIVGETLDQAREVMVFGDSGILACSPPDRRPDWIASRRLLRWPNGAEAQIFSAHDPESLRGPQFDGAWVDELAKWPKAQDTWDMLQFCLRLGDQPQVCVTTTPRNVPVLKDLLRRDSTVVTHAATSANRANLADSFLEEVEARYAGTRLGRQELAGELLEEEEGALWSIGGLERLQVEQVPDLDRIVVAVDPAVTATDRSDTCGIIVVGAVLRGPVQDWRAYVLDDASCPAASPSEWAGQAVAMMRNWDADRLVAEVNQGGDLVESVVRQIDPSVPFTKCHASRSKAARAEPVAALYEQGRVFHARGLGLLEDQMCAMTTRGYMGAGSPDRVDALVWALTHLLLEPLRNQRQPQLRAL